MELANVTYQKEGEAAIIKLNRPKSLNAVTPDLYRDFLSAVGMAKQDAEVKVVIVGSVGKAFSAGADVKVGPVYKSVAEYQPYCLDVIQQICRSMLALDKPSIAAIRGYCLGGGFEIALDCDIRIASETARFGCPEAGVGGMVSKGATKILPLLIGPARAKEMFFTTEFIDAKEAERIGLVNKVVPDAELEKAAMDMAKKIAAQSFVTVRFLREAVNRSFEQSLESQLQLETFQQLVLVASGELEKGMAAKAKKI